MACPSRTRTSIPGCPSVEPGDAELIVDIGGEDPEVRLVQAAEHTAHDLPGLRDAVGLIDLGTQFVVRRLPGQEPPGLVSQCRSRTAFQTCSNESILACRCAGVRSAAAPAERDRQKERRSGCKHVQTISYAGKEFSYASLQLFSPPATR